MKKIFVLLITLLSLVGCTNNTETTNTNTETTSVNTETAGTVSKTVTTETETSNEESLTDYTPTTNFNDIQKVFSNIKDSYSWSDTTDNAYVEINDNVPFFTDYTTEVFEEYSDLDDLGRCGVAYANICTELQPTEERGAIGMIKPSGWVTSNYNEYPGLVDGNYLYNRCHLIGFQLAGENANEKNLITGTRYLNIDGMLPFENMVDDYIDQNPSNHVMYRVTPMYIDNDLVAQGVLMEGYSVEDSGKLQFCVWCYNVQPKIYIDYSNGENHIRDVKDVEYTPDMNDNSNNESTTKEYVLNTKSKKIHLSTCKSVANMKEENREVVHKSIEELTADGYVPCKICNP